MSAIPSHSRLAALAPALPLLGFVAVVPACALAPQGGHDVARLVQLAVLLLAAALFCLRLAKEPAWPSPPALGWLAALGALALASVAAAPVPAMAARELALTVGIVVSAWLAAQGIASSRQAVSLAVLVGCSLYASLLAILAIAAVATGQPLVWKELAVGYDNYRFFNHVQTVALPLLAGLASRERRGSPAWWAAWLSMIVYAAFVWCSGARGTALAVAGAALLAGFVLGWRVAWPVARALLLAGVLGAALYAVAFLLLPAWTGYQLAAPAERTAASLASDSARLQLWRLALDQIGSSPWLGIGPMHYAHVPNPKAAHPHNVYLQIAAEWGLPMLLALLVLAGRSLVRMARAVRTAAEPAGQEGTALWVACIAILIDGAVSGNFVMPVSQMWIALCVAWSLAWMRGQGAAAAPAGPAAGWARGVARLAAAGALASQVWLVVDVWPEAVDLKAHLEHVHRDLVRNAKTNPRFWSDGWF